MRAWVGWASLCEVAVSERPCDQTRARMRDAREQCLAAIGNHYGHPPSATPAEVLAAVNTLLRVGFDLGAEYTRASAMPPGPDDPEVLTAAEELIRRLRRG